MIDLEALICSLVDERIEARLAERDRAAAQRQADADTLLTMAQVAAKLGTNRRALAERFRRAHENGAPHPLDLVAVDEQGARRWRHEDVVKYLRSRPSSARGDR